MDAQLNVQRRDGSRKGPARRLRADQRVPAIFYGPKTEPVSLSVSALELEKLLRDMGGESMLLKLNFEGEDQSRQVLIREVQVHPYRRRFLHVDFYEVPLDQQIVVEVMVVLDGEPVGVKIGGELHLLRRTLSVRCLPQDIPERVHIDVSGLEMGQSVHVQDIVAGLPFELVEDMPASIANVMAPEGAAEAAEGEAAAE